MNLPVPLDVVEDEYHQPLTLILGGQKLNITSIEDLWEIAEEWWRTRPVARRYYQVTTQDGRCITLFRDLVDGAWYQQMG